MINQFGGLFTGNANIIGVIAAVIVLAAIIYMLVRPYKGGHQADHQGKRCNSAKSL